MKIRTRINLSYFPLFMLGLILAGSIFGIYANQLITNDIYIYLSSSNLARAEHVRTYIQEKKIAAALLASASVYHDFLKEPSTSAQYLVIRDKIDKRFVRTLQADPTVHQALILDKNGIIVASSDKVEEGTDKSQDEIYTKSKQEVYFKSVYFSPVLNKFAYAIAAPILDDDGSILGTSVLRYSADDFYVLVATKDGLGKTEEDFLINADKFFITPSIFWGDQVVLKQKAETENSRECFDPAEVAYVKKYGYDGLATAVKHFTTFEFKDYRGIQSVGTHAYIPETDWCLITKADSADLFAYRYVMVAFIFFICLLAGLVIFLVGNLLARIITKPLRQLTGSTEKIKRGDYDFKSGINSQDEFGDLASSFDLMVAAIKKSSAEVDQKVHRQTKALLEKQQDSANQQKAILNILEDVEVEKSKTEVLAKDLEKFKLAVDNASDHIIITDAEGIVVYANKGVERITGFKASEVIGKKSGSKDTWGGLMPPDYYKNMWDVIKKKKQVFISELKNRRKDGEIYEVAASISPILDAGGNVLFFIGIERDITKEKQIDKAKTEFVSLASHQLRTPLAAINWYAEMLLDGDAGKLNPEQREHIEEIYQGNQRMVELVNALLNVSRLDLGTFVIDPQPTDLKLLAEAVIKEQLVSIKEKSLLFKAQYAKDLPQVNVDQKLMRMIFQNLISNAVKYTPEKGKITLAMSWDKQGILFTVADTGYGIPKSQQNMIFQKLFRADNVKGKDTEGTGLGLYIVKEIMDEAKGKVWFESAENKGSKFYVLLPLQGMTAKSLTK